MSYNDPNSKRRRLEIYGEEESSDEMDEAQLARYQLEKNLTFLRELFGEPELEMSCYGAAAVFVCCAFLGREAVQIFQEVLEGLVHPDLVNAFTYRRLDLIFPPWVEYPTKPLPSGASLLNPIQTTCVKPPPCSSSKSSWQLGQNFAFTIP